MGMHWKWRQMDASICIEIFRITSLWMKIMQTTVIYTCTRSIIILHTNAHEWSVKYTQFSFDQKVSLVLPCSPKFGGELSLSVWQSNIKLTNQNLPIILFFTCAEYAQERLGMTAKVESTTISFSKANYQT